MLKAVIFDLDGVVADSHPVHEAAWKALLAEQGLDPSSLNVVFLYAGHPRREILRHYLGPLSAAQFEALSRRKDDLFLLGANTIEPKPGIRRVLQELADAGVACALATSAGRARTEQTLAQFGIAQSFAAVIAGEDVQAAKPAPDIFLLAASRLRAQSANIVVVEDSVAGVEAARAANMICIGYALPERQSELRAAGAADVISEFPADAAQYFQSILNRNLRAAMASESANGRPRRRD